MDKSGVVHFTIGEDFGKMITKMADEHLTHNFNPLKALKAITQSLMGCPENLALDILGGKKYIGVDVATQECLIGDIKPETDCHRIDLVEWYKFSSKRIEKECEDIQHSLAQISRDMSVKTFEINYLDVFDYLANGNEDKLDTLITDHNEYSDINTFVKTIRNFIVESLKRAKAMKWVVKMYPHLFNHVDIGEYDNYMYDILDVNTMFTQLTRTVKIEKETDSDNILDNYLAATKEIDEVLSNEIQTVNINDGYTAGWLSPEGDYYALNGEIANMLHNQIADALQEKGIIPSDVELKKTDAVNKDAWLEMMGWVKIHDSNVQFAGCLNSKFDGKNVNMTNVQVEKIAHYIKVCHDGVIKLGWRLEKISAVRFEMMAQSLMSQLNKDYFEF